MAAAQTATTNFGLDTCKTPFNVPASSMRPVKAAVPWGMRLFSSISKEYHIIKGNVYLQEALDLFNQYGTVIPEDILDDLVNTWRR